MQLKRTARFYGALYVVLMLTTSAASAQDNAPVTAQDATSQATTTTPRTNLPVGSRVIVRLNTQLDSATATQGQAWSGTTASDILVGGRVAIPAGSPVSGIVTDAKSSGRLHGNGVLSLQATSVNGIAIATDTLTRDGAGHTKSNVAKIGGGAAAGAILGGLFGGGKGAAIGTVVGAGAGTAGAAATGKREATIPAETALTFTVQ